MRSFFFSLLMLALIAVAASFGSSAAVGGSGKNQNIAVNASEAQSAFEYLNRVRQNPPAFSKEVKFDLRSTKSRSPLIWNDTLQKVAEEKALDMAKRNYVAHQNPNGEGVDLKIKNAGYPLDDVLYHVDRTTSNYESLAFAASSGADVITGVNAIRGLIKDGDYIVTGHREHLLGVTKDRAKLDEVGIGYVTAKDKKYPYKYYCCVLIAKKK